METWRYHRVRAIWCHPAHSTYTQTPACCAPRGLSQTCGCQVGWQGGGKAWNLGLAEANYYIGMDKHPGSTGIAQGTVFSIL